APDAHRRATMEYVEECAVRQEPLPGAYAHADFDFERPGMPLLALRSAPRHHAGADAEVYAYPGGFREPAQAELMARLRLEQEQAAYERARGRTNARGLLTGALFHLAEHPRDDHNREYL